MVVRLCELVCKAKTRRVFFSSVVRTHRIANREGSGVRLSPISGEIVLQKGGGGIAAFAISMQFVKMTRSKGEVLEEGHIYFLSSAEKKKVTQLANVYYCAVCSILRPWQQE